MKEELNINETLDVLFEELEEKDEFALRAPASCYEPDPPGQSGC